MGAINSNQGPSPMGFSSNLFDKITNVKSKTVEATDKIIAKLQIYIGKLINQSLSHLFPGAKIENGTIGKEDFKGNHLAHAVAIDWINTILVPKLNTLGVSGQHMTNLTATTDKLRNWCILGAKAGQDENKAAMWHYQRVLTECARGLGPDAPPEAIRALALIYDDPSTAIKEVIGKSAVDTTLEQFKILGDMLASLTPEQAEEKIDDLNNEHPINDITRLFQEPNEQIKDIRNKA